MISSKVLYRTILLTTLLLAATVVFATGVKYSLSPSERTLTQTRNQRSDYELLNEDFSSGFGNWRPQDGTAPFHWNEWWHTSSTGAYDGASWWMGDETIGGYDNHRYVVLDTPDIAITQQNPMLTFMVSYNIEPGSTHEDYNAWDGFNVRISTDSGETWQILNGSPAYTSSSCYSFGAIFGEGAGVPGWTGSSSGWQQASFNLGAWSGQTVRIRFAFASDDNSCTIDEDGDPAWFGARIDNIDVAGAFQSNANGDDQMTPAYNIDMSGDFWEITDGAAHCPIENNLLDELVSPAITLPSGTHCYFSYRVLCDLPDYDNGNDGILDDYYQVFVKGANDPAWTRVQYNHSDGETPAWTFIDNTYSSAAFHGNCDLGVWSGETIQIKFQVATDDDGNTANATGLYIDDVKIYYPVSLPVPENLQCYPNDQAIQLIWDRPAIVGQEGWMFWDNREIESFIGIMGPADFEVCARFFAEDLLPYVGGAITRVKFAPGEEDCDYWIRIWDGTGTILREQHVEYPSIGGWNLITLQEPLSIEFGQVLWIGYRALTETGHPCGADTGPMVPEKGAYIRVDGGNWATLLEASEPTINANWCIEAFVDTDDGRTLPTLSTRNSRSLNGYEVYRRPLGGEFGDAIGVLNGENSTLFIDDNPPINTVLEYAVKAVYTVGISDFSIPGRGFAMAETALEYSHDDGSMEDAFEPAVGEELAVAFELEESRQIKFLRIYLDEPGNLPLIAKLWSVDPETGIPDQALNDFAVPANQLIEGWNYIALPSKPVLDAGQYCVGMMGTMQMSIVGEDTTDPMATSFYRDAEGWAVHDTGNFMIRVIADTQIGNEDPSIPRPDFAFSNYPNPFNPETNFSFYLTEPDQVKLEIFNVRGQKVITLTDQRYDSGPHAVNWSGKDFSGKPVSGGIYLCRLTTKNQSAMRKVLLLK